MTTEPATLADATDRPSFAGNLATDVDQLAAQIRAALAARRGLPPGAPATAVCTGAPEIALSGHQARVVVRALAPLALTRGRSAIRTGALSLEIADLLTALAAAGRGTAGNPADLERAIVATLALLTTLKAAAWALRWRQATTAAGVQWPDPHGLSIPTILRQPTPRAREQAPNAPQPKPRTAARQTTLLLPIAGRPAEPPIAASTTAAKGSRDAATGR